LEAKQKRDEGAGRKIEAEGEIKLVEGKHI